jgi:SEC-C motif-containing protein
MPLRRQAPNRGREAIELTMRASGESLCPCGGGTYAACCGRYVGGHALPQTAEELMRSRYAAYALDDDAYLRATWHSSSRPEALAEERQQRVKWIGLEVRRHLQSGDEATVEFVARYKSGGRAQRLHEVSRFLREDGRWYYLDGSFPEEKKK